VTGAIALGGDVRASCPACGGGWPAAVDRIAELSESTLYLHTDQFFPGWSVLVLRRHAIELFELQRDERARLIEDVNDVARALKQAFDARKVNYALFGNVVPHIHWHVIPRLAGDPAPNDPVFAVPHETVQLRPDDRTDRITRIRSRLRP
jgi:diadenosine tetraphosphate (Ap4A) HIT family hydrolase